MPVPNRRKRRGHDDTLHAGIASGSEDAQGAITRWDDQVVLIFRLLGRERRCDVQDVVDAGHGRPPSRIIGEIGGHQAEPLRRVSASCRDHRAHIRLTRQRSEGGSDFCPGIQQLHDDVRSQEAGSAGDENVVHVQYVSFLGKQKAPLPRR